MSLSPRPVPPPPVVSPVYLHHTAPSHPTKLHVIALGNKTVVHPHNNHASIPAELSNARNHGLRGHKEHLDRGGDRSARARGGGGLDRRRGVWEARDGDGYPPGLRQVLRCSWVVRADCVTAGAATVGGCRAAFTIASKHVQTRYAFYLSLTAGRLVRLG